MKRTPLRRRTPLKARRRIPRRRALRPGETPPHGIGWGLRCLEIRRRDQRTCRYCGFGPLTGAAGSVDHVLPRRLFPRGQGDFPENLALLCSESCHAIKTQMIEPALYRADYLTFSRWLDVLRHSGPVPRADQIGAALGRLRELLGAA